MIFAVPLRRSMLPYCNIFFLLKNIILLFYFVALFPLLPDFEIFIQFGHFSFKIAIKIWVWLNVNFGYFKNLAKTDLKKELSVNNKQHHQNNFC